MCDETMTSSCNNTNGFCSCFSGWNGENCTENVDECHDGGNKCGRNSTCNDTIGSYTCVCDEGYEKNNNGSCKGQSYIIMFIDEYVLNHLTEAFKIDHVERKEIKYPCEVQMKVSRAHTNKTALVA